MATLKEAATQYEAKQTKNIADLPEVDTNLVLNDGEGTDSSGEKFKYKYLELNNEEYRVPGKVLGDLKAILAENANLTKFKVTRTGTGLNTKYTVIPLG